MAEFVKPVKGESVPPSKDVLTILHGDKPTTKILRFTDGVWRKESRDSYPLYWRVESFPCRSLNDIEHRLREAGRSDAAVLIHGTPKSGADLTAIRRKAVNFDDAPHRYMVLDLDKLDTGMPSDPAEAAEIARGLLPAEFHGVKCLWSATAGHAITPGKARLRLFFWLDRAVTTAECVAWLRGCDAKPDLTIWRRVQPVFLGAEVIGGPDPILQRWGYLSGAKEVAVPLDLSASVSGSETLPRDLVAPLGVVPNTERSIVDTISSLKSRGVARVQADGRHMTVLHFAHDALDRAITVDLIAVMVEAWRAPDHYTEEDLASGLTAVGLPIATAKHLAAEVRRHGEQVAEAWTGEAFEPGDVARMIGDALRGRSARSIGSQFKPDLVMPAVMQPAEAYRRFVDAHLLDDDLDTAATDLVEAVGCEVTPDDAGRAKLSTVEGLIADVRAGVTRELPEWANAYDYKRQTPSPKPTKAPARYLSAIIAQAPEPVEQLVRGLLVAGEVAVVVGAPGAGKTSALQHLLLCIASGAEFLERRTKKGGVMYVGTENRPEDERRLLAHAQHYGHDTSLSFLFLPRSPKLFDVNGASTEGEREIIALAKAMPVETGQACKAIVIDNMRRTIAPGQTNDEAHTTIYMKAVERIRDATGAACIIVHHTIRDGSRYAGSGAIESHADSVWLFGSPDKRPKERQITFPKLRLGDKSQVLRYGFAFEIVAHDTDGEPIRTVVTTKFDPTAGALATVEDENAPTLDAPVPVAAALDLDGPEARLAMVLDVARKLGAAHGRFSAREIRDAVDARRKLEGLKTQLGRSAGSELIGGLVASGALTVEGKGPATRYIVLDDSPDVSADDREG